MVEPDPLGAGLVLPVTFLCGAAALRRSGRVRGEDRRQNAPESAVYALRYGPAGTSPSAAGWDFPPVPCFGAVSRSRRRKWRKTTGNAPKEPMWTERGQSRRPRTGARSRGWSRRSSAGGRWAGAGHYPTRSASSARRDPTGQRSLPSCPSCRPDQMLRKPPDWCSHRCR